MLVKPALRLSTVTDADVRSDEVCQMETHRAECPDNHVIVMESAQLGRLKIGMHNFVM